MLNTLMQSKALRLVIYNGLLALATFLGFDMAPEQANEYAEAILTLVPLLMAGGSAVIIKIKGKPAVPPAATVLALLLLPSMLLLAGCGAQLLATPIAQTPGQRLIAITSDYTTAQDYMLAYAKSEASKPAVVVYLKAFDRAAVAALDDARDALKTGDNLLIAAALGAAASAVESFWTEIAVSGILPTPPPRGFAQLPANYLPED
ncbi:hypothetical protein [Ferrovibrio terrae]|uniref:hypothetical protein n=1 Tax=Ferrovibrio terrae TaxID=2594003 RepID=UPI003138169D